MALMEADGTGGSGKKNLGPIYRAKKAKADAAQAELETAQNRILPLIAEQEANVAELDSMMKSDMATLERKPYGGMAARMEALHRLGEESEAIFFASIFITLLFIAIETAPIFVKLISPRSPYDHLLHQYEFPFEMEALEKTSLLKTATRNNIQFEQATSIHKTEKEIEVEKELIDIYMQRKKEELKTQPLEWKWPFVRN
jgi:hypothetical protein